ncbi:MAG: NUDIX hydrolase [Flavobacteriales bacterium]
MSENKGDITLKAHQEVMSMARPIAKAIKENPPEGMREGAVLLLLYPKDEKWSTVLIKRTKYEGVHSAQIALPGGKREAGDADMSDTALREAWEEVGVPLKEVSLLGNLSDVYIPPSNFLVSAYVGVVKSRPGFVAQESEVAEILEMDIKEELLTKTPVEFRLDQAVDSTSVMRGFHLGEHFIWGATAMILNEFRHLMLEDRIEL